MMKQPVLRMVMRFASVSKCALTCEVFCCLFRGIVCNMGYYKIITVHSLW